jgi:hypothetical protein
VAASVHLPAPTPGAEHKTLLPEVHLPLFPEQLAR